MAKKFNITGLCIPGEHFTADMSEKVDHIETMVVNGDYFTINRPRQYGKTTVMFFLEQRLQKHKDFLVYHGERSHDHRTGNLQSRFAVEENLSIPRFVKPCYKLDDGGLTAPGCAHQRNSASGMERQVECFYQWRFQATVTECDLV